MPGLPLGAAQQHDVPVEVQNYENIVGIEFIEVDPDALYPRSVAYRPSEEGGQLRIRRGNPDLTDLELAADEARAYIESFVKSGVFSWNRVYRPAQGTFVVVGKEWRLEVSFAKNGLLKKVRPFRSEGENVFPDNYDRVVSLLMDVACNAGQEQAADGQEQA